MENKDIITTLELKEKGFMDISLLDFEKTEYPDNRVVGFLGKGLDKKVFIMSSDKMKKAGLTYKDCIDDIPEVKFYNQRVDKLEVSITIEQNLKLLEDYESFLTKKDMIENKFTRKTTRSVRGLK